MALNLQSKDDLVKTLQNHENAIIHLEEGRDVLCRQLEDRMKKLHRQTYDPDGEYRGVFDNETGARDFGIYVVSKTHYDPQVRANAAEMHRRNMGTGDESAGGAAVPLEYAERVKRLIERFGVFARDAFYMPMGSGETTFLKQVGEVVVFLLEEGIAGSDSEPDFARIKLVAKEWGTLTYYPVSLDEDSLVMIGELIMRSIAYGFARKTDEIAFLGDGSSTYFGIQGIIPKLLDINGVDEGAGLVLGSGNAWSELTLGDFQRVQGRLPEYEGEDGPKWYCSRRFYYEVMVKLMLAAGGVTAEEVEGRRKKLFLGDPVELVQVMPRVEGNSQVPVIYGDMQRCATYGDRRSLAITTSNEYKFAERLVTVLGAQRVAISIEDLGTATEAGPIVGLITQSS